MATKKQREARSSKYASAKKRVETHTSGFERTTVNLPEEVRPFLPKKSGVYRIDILPYRVGKGNPFADEGMLHYERTFFVHKKIGVEENSYCCLRKTFNKPCYICDYVAKLRRDPKADKKMLKEFEPKGRQLWAVKDHSDPDSKVKIWDISFHLFGKQLDAKIKDADEDDGYENFFHLEDGSTLKVSLADEAYEGGSFLKTSNIEMKARKKPLPASILDDVPCLDDLLREYSNKELQKIFEQGETIEDDEDEDEESEEDEEEETKKPAKKSKKKKAPEPEEDEDEEESEDDEEEEDEDEEGTTLKVGVKCVHPKYGKCEIVHVSSDGTSIRIEDKKGRIHRAIDPEEVEILEEEIEDEDEEEEAKTPKSKKKKKPSKTDEEKEEEEFDEDEEEEEEEERPTKKGKGKTKKKAPEPEEDEEEDEDEDDDWEEDEDEDDEPIEEKKPAKKKKSK